MVGGDAGTARRTKTRPGVTHQSWPFEAAASLARANTARPRRSVRDFVAADSHHPVLLWIKGATRTIEPAAEPGRASQRYVMGLR